MHKRGFSPSGKQKYKCGVKNREVVHLWRQENPEKVREINLRSNSRNNPRRIRCGDMYLGMCGFTQTEREAMLSGASE